MKSYDEKIALGRKLLDKYGLHDWGIDVCNLRNSDLFPTKICGSRGLCTQALKIIRIDCNEDRSFRQTLLHEIAHALCAASESHGEAWLRRAAEVGCSFVHRAPYLLKLNLSELTDESVIDDAMYARELYPDLHRSSPMVN